MLLDKDRILIIYKKLYKSQDEFAKAVGVSPRTISTLLSTGELKKEENLRKVANALQVNADWLILRETSEVEESHSPYNAIAREIGSKPNMWVVPAKAQGGFVLGFRNRMFSHMIERVPFPMIQGECFCFEIEGFSMYPLYQPGSSVVCTFIPEPSWLRKGKTYVFQTHDGLIIKHFDRIEGGKIYLASANPAYNPVTPIIAEDIVQLYAIEYQITRPAN